MRTAVLALLLARAVLADETDGVVSSPAGELNFEIRTPPDSIDWDMETVAKENKERGVYAHLRTFWADSDPPSECNVYLSVTKLSREFSRISLQEIAQRWLEIVAGHLENQRDHKAEATKLGGADAWSIDVRGNNATTGGIGRFQWFLARNGPYLYSLYVFRSYDAVDDEDLDDELEQIVANFKFHEIRKVDAHKKGGSKGGDPGAVDAGSQGGADDEKMDPEKIKREEIFEDFWKVKCVKPEGLVRVPTDKFDESETANGTILKFERVKHQSRCMIRVYAKSLSSGQRVFTIDQLAESRIKAFEETYKKNMRQEPKIDRKWKIPGMSKDALAVKLVGRRTTTEITWWYFADCKNDRQYHVQIYVTGGTGETVWANQIEDFLKHFEPVK